MLPDLTQYLWLVWLGFIVVCITIELLTLEFTFLMIAVGSLGGLGANIAGAPWWLQILVAAALSVLLILLIRPVLLRVIRRGGDPTPSNLAALSGMTGRVVVPLGVHGGQVKLANGETWTARLDPAALASAPAAELAVGSVVSVSAISGSTAIVLPAPAPQPEGPAS